MDCPMCGAAIDLANAQVCGLCPASSPAGCRSELVRCPTCGYHTLAAEPGNDMTASTESTATFHRNGNGAAPTSGFEPGAALVRRLTELRRGEGGRIVGFGDLQAAHLRDLMAHGVMPAATVRLLQRRPAYVLELSGGDVALGSELASSILVAVSS